MKNSLVQSGDTSKLKLEPHRATYIYRLLLDYDVRLRYLVNS